MRVSQARSAVSGRGGGGGTTPPEAEADAAAEPDSPAAEEDALPLPLNEDDELLLEGLLPPIPNKPKPSFESLESSFELLSKLLELFISMLMPPLPTSLALCAQE